jgi:peroxiredoxin family protein
MKKIILGIIIALVAVKFGDDYKVFTTGSTWNYFYPNKEDVTMDELNQTGKEFCSLTIDDILKKGIKKKNAYNLCYSLSFKTVLAEFLEIKTMQIIQKEVYLKNLATSQTLFPEFCK